MAGAQAATAGESHPDDGEQATVPQAARLPDSASRPADSEAKPGLPDGLEFADDLEWYEREPLSAVPHRIVHAWGTASGSERPGPVRLRLVVDPDLTTADLEQLARDIHIYHRDAETLTVEIMDSVDAATYDRLTDQGALFRSHLVAGVRRNRLRGVDAIWVRGMRIEFAP